VGALNESGISMSGDDEQPATSVCIERDRDCEQQSHTEPREAVHLELLGLSDALRERRKNEAVSDVKEHVSVGHLHAGEHRAALLCFGRPSKKFAKIHKIYSNVAIFVKI
jgi:hypothetical protein